MSAPPGTMVNMILDRIIKVFQEPNNRERIQSQCIDPLIKYILNRMFPYIILVCIIFCIILLLSFISVGLLILQLNPGKAASTAATSAATSAATAVPLAMAMAMASPVPSPAPMAVASPVPMAVAVASPVPAHVPPPMPNALAEPLIKTTS